MQKFLIKLASVIAFAATMSILWLVGGRQLSLFVDHYRTVETASTPIKSLVYEGSGTGGSFTIDDLRLSLSPANPKNPEPHVGTTKDGQLALSFGGKVFAFGPPRGEGETLATEPQAGDDAFILIQHSVLSWIEPLNFNFMTGKSPSRKRHQYYKFTWKKPSGAKLEMLWRYEQPHLAEDGWSSETVTRQGSTGLIRVEISSPSPSPQSSP